MLLKKTMHKTKNFFNKPIQHFKSSIFGGYRKLTRSPSLRLFSTNPKLDNIYKEFCEQLDPDRNNNASHNIKVSEKGDIESNGSAINSERTVLKNKKGAYTLQDHKSVVSKEASCSKFVLEQKMKELKMMDMKDEEQVLDIEEVLHYYSLLTSPIYQDLIDNFFIDMYTEFQLPQPSKRSNSMNSSMRRLGPLNI